MIKLNNHKLNSLLLKFNCPVSHNSILLVQNYSLWLRESPLIEESLTEDRREVCWDDFSWESHKAFLDGSFLSVSLFLFGWGEETKIEGKGHKGKKILTKTKIKAQIVPFILLYYWNQQIWTLASNENFYSGWLKH